MVANSRTPTRADQLRTIGCPDHRHAPGEKSQFRSLNTPRAIRVTGQRPDGHPAAIIEGHKLRRIAVMIDEWWVEDEWWRDPISRHYLQVQLADGVARTIYHDTITDIWYTQTY